ncbi:hypothetical protein GUJ93_ZPchr0009g1999 [Zizania palustris]|uniref:Uncharacterized protein n=1 Tax=Zizania palustris TaxID=103762 RepID=A0A8J5S332_ZIZPA|nr:hypothetical protein GUJ93_ZPchr0009g1999 [Zizania palustris]
MPPSPHPPPTLAPARLRLPTSASFKPLLVARDGRFDEAGGGAVQGGMGSQERCSYQTFAHEILQLLGLGSLGLVHAIEGSLAEAYICVTKKGNGERTLSGMMSFS